MVDSFTFTTTESLFLLFLYEWGLRKEKGLPDVVVRDNLILILLLEGLSFIKIIHPQKCKR